MKNNNMKNNKKTKILLNGVGRIGKAILRIVLEEDSSNDINSFEIVAINEINPNIKSIAYSINYDSTYGSLRDKFKVVDNTIANTKTKIEILNHKSLLDIDMSHIDIVIDASGSKLVTEELRSLDVRAIFLSHPYMDADINVVLGVNEGQISPERDKIISTSSCNATALLPILKLIDDHYNIECGDICTIHPLLNHQRVLDSGCIGSVDRGVECNLEFGRSATQNIIPSQTTTIEACSYTLPHINADIISSNSLRVPTSTVGAIALTLFLQESCSKDEIVTLCQEYEKNQKFDIMLNNHDALVSSDFQQERYTTIIDHRFTELKMGKMLKLLIWYDNEWGYATKVVDIVKLFESKSLNKRNLL